LVGGGPGDEDQSRAERAKRSSEAAMLEIVSGTSEASEWHPLMAIQTVHGVWGAAERKKQLSFCH
jgi:hypothetical protein